jgi:hypothetical protein
MRAPCLSALALAIGCAADLTPPPDPMPAADGPRVTTLQMAYSWQHDSAAILFVSNPLNAPVYYTCGPFALQRYRDGWKETPNPLGWVDCGVQRMHLTDSLYLRLELTNDFFPTQGWYRLIYPLYRDTALSQLWPEGNRASPAFEVRR